MFMDNHERSPSFGNKVDHLKGCPICERSDPQLERELHAFAQLLFDIWLARQSADENPAPSAGIDKGP